MRDRKADKAKWEELHHMWVLASQKAREKQAEITSMYAACAHGRGTGPTDEMLFDLEYLDRQAQHALLAENAFLKEVFG